MAMGVLSSWVTAIMKFSCWCCNRTWRRTAWYTNKAATKVTAKKVTPSLIYWVLLRFFSDMIVSYFFSYAGSSCLTSLSRKLAICVFCCSSVMNHNTSAAIIYTSKNQYTVLAITHLFLEDFFIVSYHFGDFSIRMPTFITFFSGSSRIIFSNLKV